MRLLSLAKILRGAGLTVHEVSGWKSRGDGDFGPARGITVHHTGGARTSTDEGEIRTLLTGSSSAPAPIAQLYLSRTGAWHVVASGVCWHSLVGWAGPNKGLGNYDLLGVEAQHSGGDEPWTNVQYGSYVRGVAALCAGLDIPPARVAGHKEHQPGDKSDPTFNMDKFRSRVAAAMKGDDVPTVAEIWGAAWREYVDEDGNNVRDPRRAADFLVSAHSHSVAAARSAAKALLVAEAVLAAVTDGDHAAVLARIEQLAEQEAQRDRVLLDLLRAHSDGTLTAEAVVARIGELLAGPAAPPAA
jgi:hypothetical protein